jgi:hypothetical protein
MAILNSLKAMTQGILGERVDRATATLPQTAAAAIFNVTGGRVAITSIIGQVTTIIQNQANNTKLTANPTTGTSADICAVLSIANDEVGTLYTITGTLADAMHGAVAGAAPLQAKPVVVNIGSIDLNCAASNTGSVKWTVHYIPIDDGAAVTAA